MKYYNKIIMSNGAPGVKDALWMKPVTGGFTLYCLDGGKWLPIKLMDDNETSATIDDVVDDMKDKADKVKSATNGHLAALNSKGNLTDSGAKASDFAPLGTAQDGSNDMTLYGLKAYVDLKTT